ncbi:hypothetical protein [Sphaerisporangium sp. TRM90804]|uniref:hypothetical protein n=1 Tax=Sphaerisporangium sp. TRM90804 TaxID=3031113 RepID=UPI00244A7E2C|nr:hypothetical protein [Sphaerisporangium sp. TRM90804]MDH2430541.1 hypothetical protein [Sphaerisporangium sp. TRM90804]
MERLARRLAWGAAGALGLGLAGWVAWQSSGTDLTGLAPQRVVSVDPATRDSLLNAVDQYLETDPERSRGMLDARPSMESQMFCHEELVEVRQSGPDRLVGVVAHCQELAPSGGDLVAGTGYVAPMLLTLEPRGGRFAVREFRQAGDGAAYTDSVREMFSAEGAPRAFDVLATGSRMEERIRSAARTAFGLSPEAEVVRE